MAKLNLATTFWKTVKTISIKEISNESQRPFALAVIGDPAGRAEVLDRLFPGATSGDVLPGRSLIRQFDSTAPEDGFPAGSGAFDVIIDAGGGRVDAPEGARIFSLSEIGSWDALEERLLEERADLALALGRRFPGLRPAVAQRVIRDTSIANAEFAMLSALPGVIPIIGPLLPPAALADIFMLTKNQAMMMVRLAALYELPLDLSSRSGDLAPLLATAFGWRALARELVAVVPGGVGMIARGTIAYAGTHALGKAIHRLYQTGKRPTRQQLNQFYREAIGGARQTARRIAGRLTGKPAASRRAIATKTYPPPALTSGDESAPQSEPESPGDSGPRAESTRRP